MADGPPAKNARPHGDPSPGTGGPAPGPPEAGIAPAPAREGGQKSWGNEQEGPGGGRGAEDPARSAHGDTAGSGAAAAATSPVETKVRKQEDVISHFSDAIKQLTEVMKEISDEIKQLTEVMKEILEENKQLNKKVDQMPQCLKDQVSQPIQLSNKSDEEVNRPKQELKKAQEKPSWFPGFGGKNITMKDFQVQVQITGKTGGCEANFLKEVKERLFWHRVSLKAKPFTEASKDLLLIFCPIASRMGTDIENALKELLNKQKTILVVMHFVQRDITGTLADAGEKVTHPAVVRTVHTRYTIQDGLYPCEMNKAAMDEVADAIQALAEDPPQTM